MPKKAKQRQKKTISIIRYWISDCKGCQNDLQTQTKQSTNQPSIQYKNRPTTFFPSSSMARDERMFTVCSCVSGFFFSRRLRLLAIIVIASLIRSLFFRLIWMVEWSLDYFHKYFDYLNTIVFSICQWQTLLRQQYTKTNTNAHGEGETDKGKNGIFRSLLRFVEILTNVAVFLAFKCVTSSWPDERENSEFSENDTEKTTVERKTAITT